MRTEKIRCSAATVKGPSASRRSRSSGTTDRRAALGGVRVDSVRRMRASFARRSANSTTAIDDASNHWTSSMATTTSPSAARVRSKEPNAVPSRRLSGGFALSTRRRAASSAARCGVGSDAKAPSGIAVRRSVSPVNERLASDSADPAASTRAPRSRASRTASSQTVVLPIPGSPMMASPVRPGWIRPDRPRSRRSRPRAR